MPPSATVSSLPSSPSLATLPARMRHCAKGPLGCDECLGVLALTLATTLDFRSERAEEMSLGWYLAHLGADRSREPEARELQALTAQLCMGLDLMAEADAAAPADEPEAPMQMQEAGEAPETAFSGPPATAVTGLWVAIGGVAAAAVALLALAWKG